MVEKLPGILPKVATFTSLLGSFTTWDRRLYFPSEERRAGDFFAGKIRRLRSGLNPRTQVPKASTLTSRPPKPLLSNNEMKNFPRNFVWAVFTAPFRHSLKRKKEVSKMLTPSVRLWRHVNNKLFVGFSWNSIWKVFTKRCRLNTSSVKIWRVTVIGEILLLTFGEGGVGQNRPWVWGTLIYGGVSLERSRRLVTASP